MIEPSADMLRYPIGKFVAQEVYSTEELQQFISRIESLPGKVEAAVQGMTTAQLNTPYRDGGWTVRQVIHHIPDSHMNAYIRLKWTLTEDNPTIKAYAEKPWAETPETLLDPVISLNLLKALHIKWVALLKNLSATDLQKQFFHPDSKKYIRVTDLMGTYAWHGDHHLGHILGLKARMGW
jgi:hypothetical protein